MDKVSTNLRGTALKLIPTTKDYRKVKSGILLTQLLLSHPGLSHQLVLKDKELQLKDGSGSQVDIVPDGDRGNERTFQYVLSEIDREFINNTFILPKENEESDLRQQPSSNFFDDTTPWMEDVLGQGLQYYIAKKIIDVLFPGESLNTRDSNTICRSGKILTKRLLAL